MKTLTPEEILKGIDADKFRHQRRLLTELICKVGRGEPIGDMAGEYFTALQGIETLLDCVADTCHDLYGMDTLWSSEEDGGEI